jgi:sodium transport system permease protein
MNHALTIARKEIIDGLRDIRSLFASLCYALMGPIVVGFVSLATRDANPGSSAAVLTGMMAVFMLVSAFVGGMNVAMDTVAGERERRSLLPLLLNPVGRSTVLLGKWLAVSFFALVGSTVTGLGFLIVFATSGVHPTETGVRAFLPIALGLLSLPLLAAAVQLMISTVSRGVKEAQTYLSLIVFGPMGVGMFLVFRPAAKWDWCSFVPLVGQQLQLEALMNGQHVRWFQPIVLGYLTGALALMFLLLAANRLQRDEIIYGN